MRRAVLVTVLALGATLSAPSTAQADPPTTQVTPGQVFAYPSSVEFDWNVTDAAPYTVITVVYEGCGGQVAGYHQQEATDASTFTVHGNPSKLGADWTRTLVVEQEGADTYVETVTNTEPSLQFQCSDKQEPIVATWSKKSGKVKSKPFPGDKLTATATKLNDFGVAKGARLTYTWTAGQETVGKGRSLKVSRKWVGDRITLTITAATSKAVWRQTKALDYGVVQKKRERRVDYSETNWRNVDRILGPDRAGVHVFQQYRPCGKGRWRNYRRQTTTKQGVFDFSVDTPAGRKKYKEKKLSGLRNYPEQASIFIPADDEYKAYRFVSAYCL